MSSIRRRIFYVFSYELLAILLTTLGLSLLGYGGSHSALVAIVSSATALAWNFMFSSLFEAWERRQTSTRRTVGRRIAHALGFEGGLVLILIPILAMVLGVSLREALVLEAGLLIFFLIYTFVFAWVFDKIVPVREASKVEASPTAGLR